MAQDPSGSSKDPKDEPQAKGRSGQPPAQTGAGTASQQSLGHGGPGQAAAIDPQLVQQVAQALAGLVPTNVVFQQAQPRKVYLEPSLDELPPVTVAFPPCSDVLLALINTTIPPQPARDPINGFFNEYFRFERHLILAPPRPPGERPDTVLDPALLQCTSPSAGPVVTSHQPGQVPGWPPPWCLPPSCVTLKGDRRMPADSALNIKRLLFGDIVWLFFFERMGIFKILGVILDDFAIRGQYPISNGNLDAPTIKDDVVALVLEAMCRQTKMGLSSTVRDRDATYRRCLGWTSDVGRPLGIPAQINKGKSQLFHKFLLAAIRFNEAKRLAVAIQGVAAAPKPSVATLVEIADTVTQLKQRLEVLHYGRNYYNTLAGIVWAVAGLALIRDLRTTLGIPPAYEAPHEYIPAAYDKLVLGGSVTPTTINRFEAHKDCATFGRNLLLDIEVLPEAALSNPQVNGDFDLWLTQVEGEIEGYRKAYRDLTGVDLGAPGTPAIEQEA